MQRDTTQEMRREVANIKTYDLKSELQLVQAILCGSREVQSNVMSEVETSDFYDETFGRIFKIACEDIDNGFASEGCGNGYRFYSAHPDDVLTFHYNTAVCAGMNDIVTERAEKATIPHVLAAARSIKKKRELRELVQKLYETIDICRHETNPNDKAFTFLQDVVFGRAAKDTTAEYTKTREFGEGMLKVLYENNDPATRQQKTININWPKFQRMTGGFGLEDLVIVSAPSGNGKSAFALNIACNVGVTQNQSTLYINSELSNEQMQMRVDSLLAYVDSKKIRMGEYYDEKRSKETGAPMVYEPVENAIYAAAELYNKRNLRFMQIPDLQINNIERAIRTDKAQFDSKLVIVDYLGRMDITKTAGVKDLQEWQIMRLAANRLKTLAQRYKVCIIMVAQLTDEGTLQGAKAMKNECEMWLNINRVRDPEKLYNMFPFNTVVEIRKARNVDDLNGITMRYDGCMMRFNDVEADIKLMIDRNKQYGRYANEIMSDADYMRLSDKVKHDAEMGRQHGR